jgi:hypothetical protein
VKGEAAMPRYLDWDDVDDVSAQKSRSAVVELLGQ